MTRSSGIAVAWITLTLLVGVSCRSSGVRSAASVLNQADAALSATQQVRYRFEYEGTGSMAGNFSGEAMLLKRTDTTDAVMRARVVSPGGPTYEGFTDGRVVQLVEHDVKRFRHGTVDGAGTSLFTIASYGTLLEFVRPAPFQQLVAENEIEFVGTEAVGGVECDVVLVRRRGFGGNADDTWWISREDGLPRAQRWMNVPPAPEGSFMYTLFDVATGFEPDVQGLVPPEGYAVVDADRAEFGVGGAAPDWSLKTASGETIRLSERRGRYVVLALWASWCPICHRMLPELDRLAQRFPGEPVDVFAASVWEQDDADAIRWVEAHDPSWTHLIHGDDVATDYGLAALPGLFLIGPEGTLIESRHGPTGADIEAIKATIENGLSAESLTSN